MNSRTESCCACVFDLDGTLIDSRSVIERAAQATLSEVCPEWCGRPITTTMGPPIREMFKRVLGTDVGEPMLDRLVAVFRRVYDSEGLCRETPTYPGVEVMLTALARQGVRLFVLTNKPQASSRQILAQRKIESLFAEIVTPDWSVAPFTSKARGLEMLLQRLRLTREHTMLVGDTLEDAAAAEACEVPFVAALYGYGILEAEAARRNWLTIRQPADILMLFRRDSVTTDYTDNSKPYS